MGSTGGDNLSKLAKKCMKITNQHFLVKTVGGGGGGGGDMGEKINFWVVGEDPPSPLPPTRGNLFSDSPCQNLSALVSPRIFQFKYH